MEDQFIRYFWVMGFVVTFLNVNYLKRKAKENIVKDPSLAPGYKMLIRGYTFWMNIPWIVMGIGMTIGGVPNEFAYFNPREGNPYVLAFYATCFLSHILGAYWIFFRNGAQILVSHPGVFNTPIKSPAIVKLFTLMIMLFGTCAAISMWTNPIKVQF